MTLNLIGYFFLVVVCGYHPQKSLVVFRLFRTFRPPPRHAARYLRPIAMTVIYAAFAVITARSCGINILGSDRVDHVFVAVVAAFLVVSLGTLPLQRRYRSAEMRLRLWAVSPVTRGERLFWVPISLLVGVGEEIVFRAVTFILWLMITGNAWLAALLSAVAFGLVHVSQGWLGAASGFLMALGFQVMVELTGGLYAAMTAHTLHNLVAGLIIGRWKPGELSPDR